MLARYPKLEAAHIRGSASNTITATAVLPRLCLGQNESSIEKDEHEVNWLLQPGRGCDSAPVVAEEHQESSRFFVLGDHIHRHHHQHYPRCHRHQQTPREEEQQLAEDKRDSIDQKSVENLQFQLHSLDESTNRTAFRSFSTNSGVVNSDNRSASIMDISPEEDFKRLSRCVDLLHASGYYYEGLSWQQATLKLRKCKVGTFLVRESENANFLFTLSVQTKKGPTSVRLAYKDGQFRLDSDENLISFMPLFDTVTDLVEHYVRISREAQYHKGMSCCWLDLAGDCNAPVELYSPLYKQVHSLKHLCRLNAVRQLKKCSLNHLPVEWTLEHSRNLCLPLALKEYIKEYPYGH